ncbi:alpha/beta fold hydrolase [Antrihabitans sp. YC2-6]|uniref:alpha/beta fold hydrolase n=1 Tax=Antrihabitans sp. YC2-6 TaxID=2799498 RepID=UPI0018F304A1|nr:alpha/beta fold hydrolase [Antrihabitans sp. YC2-6]MBJ8348433.1 alpha/beta fold hydrolase [Antrihabitans sp. YC2-6]
MHAAEQRLFRTEVAGRDLAWSAIGSGPPLVVGGWWCSHLDLDWQNSLFRSFVGRIAEQRTVIRYDRPGIGLSGPAPGYRVTLAAEVDNLSAVIEAATAEFGSSRFDLAGMSSGGGVVACYASRNPDRVGNLVIYGSYIRGTDIADAKARDAIVALVAEHWGVASKYLADIFLPDASADDRRDFVEFQRASATAEVAAETLRAVYDFDAGACLTSIDARTLVMHRRQDKAIPFGLGRRFASSVAGAQFLALDGLDHYPWRGDSVAITDAILEFLGAPRQSEPSVPKDLSGREREVVVLIAQGLTDQEIAARLTLSTHTVHRHVANIRTKLGVSSRAAAAAHAVRSGWV